MNIYLREMRANMRSLLLWCGGVFVLIAAGMAKYAGYEQVGQSINELVHQMPKAVQAMVGANYFDLSRASGFYGVLFSYFLLMATIHAAMLGAGIIAKEERDRTSEFLYVKPVSRATIFTSKLLAAVTNAAVLNLMTWASSVLFVGLFANGENVNGDIALLMGAMALLQLLFLAVGVAAAALTHRPKAAAGTAAGILLLTFVLASAVDLNEGLTALRYVTPFKYFEAKDVMYGGGLNGWHVALTAAVAAALTAASAAAFRRKDMNV